MGHADNDLITLDKAAKLIPGADANTLKRLARAGKLPVYRPGKKYLTTAADVLEAVRRSRVVPKVAKPVRSDDLPNPLGLTSTQLASIRLEAALAPILAKGKEEALARFLDLQADRSIPTGPRRRPDHLQRTARFHRSACE